MHVFNIYVNRSSEVLSLYHSVLNITRLVSILCYIFILLSLIYYFIKKFNFYFFLEELNMYILIDI